MSFPTVLRSYVDDLLDEWEGPPPDPTTDDEAEEEEEANPLVRLEDGQTTSWVRRWYCAQRCPKRSVRPVRMLMLHDYAASGWSFAEETRGLARRLQRDLPAGIELHYPDAHFSVPCRRRRRRPAFLAGDTTFRGWSPADDAVDSEVRMKESLRRLLSYVSRYGPFDGVLGLGQGATIGALLVSLCEGLVRTPEQACRALSIQSAPRRLRRFKYFISVAGCKLANIAYNSFYEPKTTIASLHLVSEMGPFDLVARMDALPFCFENAEVVQYFRWHSWPNIKENRSKLFAFILKEITGEESLEVRDHAPMLDVLVEFSDPFR